jgi:GxxExxY protein
LAVERQQPLPLVYGDVSLDCAYRIDLLVEDAVVVEVKSVARLDSVHEAQLMSYLKLSRKTVGLLLNFNVKLLARDGIKRRVNGFPER